MGWEGERHWLGVCVRMVEVGPAVAKGEVWTEEGSMV